MATTLPNSGLKLMDEWFDDWYADNSKQGPGETDWRNEFEDNWTRLNNVLLKLNALSDVDDSGLVDGEVLKYNSSTTKWEPWMPHRTPFPTTTTSSTTSTSTSTTTSSTTSTSTTSSTTTAP